MRLIIDGFNKSITKRDNQIVIKEDGKEIDYFLARNLKQIIILGKGAITFDAIALLADSMGHESIETTRIYLRRTATEQQNLVDKIVTW